MKKVLKIYHSLSIQVKATLWFTVSNVLQKGVQFLTVPIFTRILNTEQYGNYSVFLSWLEIFEIIATYRLSWGGYVVGLNKYENDRDGYTSSIQMLSLIITTCNAMLYLELQNLINGFTGLNTLTTIIIFGILLFMPAIQLWTVKERVEYRYKNVLLSSVSMSILIVLIGSIAALVTKEKDLGVIIARLIVQGAFGVVFIWCNCHKDFIIYNKEYWTRSLRFNIPLLPYYLSLVVLHSSDRIIIDRICGANEAGIYSVAYTLSTCMQIFSSSINQTVQPWLYQSIKKDKTEKVPSTLSFLMLLVAAINLIFIALAPEIISILVPDKYREAIWVIPPLAGSVVVMFFYQHFVNIEFYFEESKLTAIASIGAAILNLFLNYIYVPKYGFYAAGYTTLISYLLFSILHYIFMNIVCRKNNYTKKLVNIKQLLIILVLFFLASLLLMIGYNHVIIRMGFILLFIVIVIMKRKIIVIKVLEIAQSKNNI